MNLKFLACTAVLSAFCCTAELTAADKLPPILGVEQYGSRILLLDTNNPNWDDRKARLWDWHPVFDTEALLPQCIPWFGGITDAKPVLNMTHLLITGSCGGVTLVRMKDKRTMFCAFSRGSHSAEILPDGNIVSTGAGPDGRLDLFIVSTYDPLHPEYTKREVYPLPGAHGAVWDHKQNCLWVSEDRGISRWEYTAKPRPALKQMEVFRVPKFELYYGHDLCPVPGSRKLYLTGDGIAVFDTEAKKFVSQTDEIYPKSISQAEPNGPIIVAIPQERWWTDTAEELKDGKLTPFRTRKNMRFYKFRWFIHNEFSYGPLVR